MPSMSPTSSLKKHGQTVVTYHAVSESSSTVASSSSSLLAPSRCDVDSRQRHRSSKWWVEPLVSTKRYLASEVDGLQVTPPLCCYAFMTGYIDAISFSAIFVWCGFQTGNFAQLALSVAGTIESYFLNPRIGVFDVTTLSSSFPASQHQYAPATSFLAFVLGLATFGRLGDRIGTHKRGWLFAGTLIQAALTLASAITFWNLESSPSTSPMTLGTASSSMWGAASSSHPSWQHYTVGQSGTPTAVTISPEMFVGLGYLFGVACLSASFGVQGIMARRLDTQFSTTIVLTAVFVELITEPTLFQIRRRVRSRDQKWLAAISLFLGVVVGRLVFGQLGTALTIGVGVFIRIGIAIWWLFIPENSVSVPLL